MQCNADYVVNILLKILLCCLLRDSKNLMRSNTVWYVGFTKSKSTILNLWDL